MAFQPNAMMAQNVASMFPQQQDESWKSQGFINIYLPTTSGTRRKIGTIYLKETKALEKHLLDRLKADPEATLQALANKLEFDFNTAEEKDEQFDL